MSKAIETLRLSDNRVLEIYYDDDPSSPREWDNAGIMVCLHKRYSLGDKHGYSQSDFESWDGLANRIVEDYGPCTILPLYLYDHSGLTMRCGKGFGDVDSHGWDWGQVGFILMPHKDAKKEFGKVDPQQIEELLQQEVATYDSYLRGSCFGFVLKQEIHCEHCGTNKSEQIDSCWGYFGEDWTESGILEALSPELAAEVVQQKGLTGLAC